MTDLAWILLAVAGAFAALDWVAVVAHRKGLEYVAKPAAMAGLVAVAVVLDPRSEAMRWAFVCALVASLVGDVFLMLPTDRFVAGLSSFFAAHVAYVVGLRMGRTDLVPLIISALFVLTAVALVGSRIMRAVRLTHPELGAPVAAYIAVIAVMGASALASGLPFAATGALLFMASDALIAWNRFVRPLPWAPVAIMLTYHLGQAGLTLSLSVS